VRAGRTPEELAGEFESIVQAIRNWVRRVERDAGRPLNGLTSEEPRELVRLRRETRSCVRSGRSSQKAAAWIAPETGSVSPNSLSL
jgi:transposase-like protein